MRIRSLMGVGAGLLLAALGACNKNKTSTGGPTTGLGQSMSGERPEDLKVPKIDASLCQADAGGRIVAYDLNHDDRADEWKVYRSVEERGVKTEVLTCKQVDLDHDPQARKDYVVQYDTQGNILLEEVDYDFDGKFDARRHYDKQTKKLTMLERNTNFDDKPDLWEEYDNAEKLGRVLRDRNGDQRPDYWELYSAQGKLEAILYDEDWDGKVDKREDAVGPGPPPAATAPADGSTPPADGSTPPADGATPPTAPPNPEGATTPAKK
jgi:hypothetical protein